MSKLIINSQEYLNLIQKLLECQYDYNDTDNQPTNYNWIPAEPEAKSKLKRINANNKVVDLTNVKKDKIKSYLNNYGSIKVGYFLMKVTPSAYDNNDIIIFQEVTHTKNGLSCNLLNKIDILKDSRFNTCDWRKYFNQFKRGNAVPSIILPDIIKWLQVVIKLSSFV